MKYKPVLILILLVMIAGCGGAGGGGSSNPSTIKGTVVDINHDPVSQATITTDSLIASSLSDGTYTFNNVSSGVKILAITKQGYTTTYRKVTVSGGTSYASIAILALLDTKITQIGGGGGGVSNLDGSVSQNLPPGALSGLRDITLTSVPLDAAPYPPPAGSEFIAVIIYITPRDETLGTQATISIPNLTNLTTATSVPFYHFNTATLEWELIADANGVASQVTKTITAKIRLFGWVAAIVPIAPQAGNISGLVTDLSTGLPVEGANIWTSSFSTTTNSDGTYLLSDISTGELTVYALATGYNQASKSVTVNPGATATCNFSLVPKNTGTIHGKISDIGTLAGISNARIIGPSNLKTTTNSDGDYVLYSVPAGFVAVTAYANGYINNSISGILSGGGDLTLNLGLTPTNEATVFSDDFETDKGWTVISDFPIVTWQRKPNNPPIYDSLRPTYVTLPVGDSGQVPNAHGGSYCYWYGQIPEAAAQGCYICTQESTDSPDSGGTSIFDHIGTLTSPPIDLTGNAYATLSFFTWWEIEGINPATGYDTMMVQITANNGSTWNDIALLNPSKDPDRDTKQNYYPYSSGGYNLSGLWVKHTFDISPYVGNVIKIRFEFNTHDNKYNGFRGWLIDDLTVNPNQTAPSSISKSSVNLRPDRGMPRITPR
ncbi:MAG: carboxypeptidase regulatory-like domain-containing protein [Candidatus Saganbacteria bacterium]|nr:carboxypeptidase regulatory-like domain-containing protein [Candidatus Saganbacteria bacterium]